MKRNKSTHRIIAALLSLLMLSSCLPMTAFAMEEDIISTATQVSPEPAAADTSTEAQVSAEPAATDAPTETQVPAEAVKTGISAGEQVRTELESAVSAEDYPNGLVHFLTPNVECEEGQKFIELAVVRYGSTADAASVDIKAIDISAKFGEDYRISIVKTFFDEELKAVNDSQSIVELAAADADKSTLTLGEGVSDTETRESDATADEKSTSAAGESQITETEFKTDDAKNSTVNALASARSAMLGVPTDTSSWQEGGMSKEEAASVLLKQNQNYYDELPGATATLNFKTGEYKKILRVYIVDDEVSESDEQVMLVLSNANGTDVDPNPTSIVNIKDNEAAEAAEYAFAESVVYAKDAAERAEVTLLRTSGVERYSVVTVGTSALTAEPGEDYTSQNQQLTFVAGQTRQTISVPITPKERSEPATFNLQVQNDDSDACVTIVLPASDASTPALMRADTPALMSNDGQIGYDPIDGGAFCDGLWYGGLSSGHYRMYKAAEYLSSSTSNSAETKTIVPVTLAGVEKINAYIKEQTEGTKYTYTTGAWFWKKNHEAYHTGCDDSISFIGGSLMSRLNKANDFTYDEFDLSDSERKHSGLVISAKPTGSNSKTEIYTTCNFYINPVELILRTPADEDADGTVRAYTWTEQNTKSDTYTSYKMGTLGFVGEEASATSKIVYPDGDVSGKVSFEAAYNESITQAVKDKTYLWGYKIERKAGQVDGRQWYYVKGTDFDVTSFFKDEMKDSVTGNTIYHGSCGDTKEENGLVRYRYIIQPVFKAREANVSMVWDGDKLQSYHDTFQNGGMMTVGMLDTINYHLVNVDGVNELPSAYVGYASEKQLSLTESNENLYRMKVVYEMPVAGISLDDMTLTLSGSTGQSRQLTLTPDKLVSQSSGTFYQTFTFPLDVLDSNWTHATLKIPKPLANYKLSYTIEKLLQGTVVQQAIHSAKTINRFSSAYALTCNTQTVFEVADVDNIPYNASEPGKLSFTPSAPFTMLYVKTGTAALDVRYDPISSSEGKDKGDVFYVDGDGATSTVDPNNGLAINSINIGQPYSFTGIYNDEGNGSDSVLKNDWRIIWKDWTGDQNRDGTITDEEDALLGEYSAMLNRTAVTGNAYQFVPQLPNSQLYYAFVKRDPAPDNGEKLTIEGRIFLRGNAVLDNSGSKGSLDYEDTPVPGAVVTVDGESVTTSADGKFSFQSANYRSGENYQAVISYDGLTYSCVLEVGAFKRICLEEYRYFTPYNFKGYIRSGDSYNAMNLSNPMYPNNADAKQKYTFTLSENMPNITAKEVQLSIYNKEGGRLHSFDAAYDTDTRLWSAEFNPANYTGATEGAAPVIPAGSTMAISVTDTQGVTYPEYQVGMTFKKHIGVFTFLNSFKSPVNGAIDYIGELDAEFDLGLSVKADELVGNKLADSVTTDGNSILVSMGISKAFEGEFGGEEEVTDITGGDDNGNGDGNTEKDAGKSDTAEDKAEPESHALDYLKEVASSVNGEGSDIEKIQTARDAISSKDGEAENEGDATLLEGYQLDMGVAFYLTMTLDEDKGEFYFDGLVVCAAMLGDVGYKFEMATPIGITLHAGMEFGANLTGLVVVEPYNYKKLYFDGEGQIDLTKIGDSDIDRDLTIYGKLIVAPKVTIMAGASVGTGKLSAGAYVKGTATFDMAFSTAGSGEGSATVTAELILDVLGGMYSKNWTLVDKTWQMFSYSRAARMLGKDDYRYDTISADDTMSRDYLENRGEWNNSIALFSASDGWRDEKIVQSGAYPYAYPLLSEIGDAENGNGLDQLMVFLDDSSAQGSAYLYYSLCENGNWSTPVQVDNDETGDDTPNMFDLGDEVLVVWSDSIYSVGADVEPIDAMNGRDIQARFFNKATCEWGEVTAVTKTTEQDTTGDDTPSIAYCENADGERYLMITYNKSAYTSSNDGDDALVGDLLEPVTVQAYRFYNFDSEQWVDAYDSGTISTLNYSLHSEEAVTDYEQNWYGQGFIDLSSYASDSQARDSVGYDPQVTENEGIGFIDANGHAIGVNAYVVDTDGQKDTLSDRDIFLHFYDFTDKKFYAPVRLTEDAEEHSYISPVTTVDGAELFFLSNGKIQEVNLEYLWNAMTVTDGNTKTIDEDNLVVTTAVESRNPELPITEFVIDSDGANEFIFWTERQITYANGVEETDPEASLAKNQYAERQIWGAWRSMAAAKEETLHSYDEANEQYVPMTYPATDAEGHPIDYDTTPDINGNTGIVKAGDNVTVRSRNWGGAIQITDEQGANYSGIDMASIRGGAFRLVYLKGYSAIERIGEQEIVAENEQNRALCTADIDLSYLSYNIDVAAIDSIPENGTTNIPLNAEVTNLGFLADDNLAAELFVSINGGEAQLADTIPLDSLNSGETRKVTLYWDAPADLSSVEFTVNVLSKYGNDDVEDDLWATNTASYARAASIDITVHDAHMVERNTAEVRAHLLNRGDATATDYTISSGSDSSQKFTLAPGEENMVTFFVNVPDEAFVAQTLEDGSVIETAEIVLSAGATPCITTVSRTATADDMALMTALESVSLKDNNGNTISDSISIKSDEILTLSLEASMSDNYSGTQPVLMLISNDGELICNGDSLYSSIDGEYTLNAYIIPRGDAAVLTAGGLNSSEEVLPTLAAAAVRTIPLTVTVSAKGGSSHGSSGNTAAKTKTVTFNTNGGTPISSITLKQGTTIDTAKYITEKDGYIFDGWYTDEALTMPFTSDTKVTSNLVLYAKWSAKTPDVDGGDYVNPFKDISKNDWFYNDVKYVVDKGLFKGVKGDEFAPQNSLTRAMLVTVLYRAEGEPNIENGNLGYPFADVDAASYYANAVYWARKNGIVKGYSDDEFAPEQNITREQIAAIVFRYAKFKKTAPEGEWAIRMDYVDLADISEWATEAVMYCNLKGIMLGNDNNEFKPLDNTTRAETAAILRRYLEN